MIKQFNERLSSIRYRNQKIYIGIATKEIRLRSTIHKDKAEELLSILDKKENNYQLTYQYFINESHGTVFIPGFLDGIKKLYEQ